MKSLGSERGNHPTMHNLNPLSETVKSVRKKKEKQSPFVHPKLPLGVNELCKNRICSVPQISSSCKFSFFIIS